MKKDINIIFMYIEKFYKFNMAQRQPLWARNNLNQLDPLKAYSAFEPNILEGPEYERKKNHHYISVEGKFEYLINSARHNDSCCEL